MVVLFSIIGFCITMFFLYRYLFVAPSQKELLQEAPPEPPIEEVPLAAEALELKYSLNTDRIKYFLYSSSAFKSFTMEKLYTKFVVQKGWVDEPFHSAFFRILLGLGDNELMIMNPNSKILTLCMRDENERMTKSKSYEVFSTNQILESVLSQISNKIFNFSKTNAQNIILAICIIAIKKSTHYLQREEPLSVIDKFFVNYENLEDIKYILTLIEKESEQLLFIKEAFEDAQTHAYSYPYNDSGVSIKPLEIASNLPKKILKQI